MLSHLNILFVFGAKFKVDFHSLNTTPFSLTINAYFRYKLWLGSTESEILVRDMSHLDTEERRLTAHSSPSGRQQCIFIATPLNTPTATHSAWTYNYPGWYRILFYREG